MKIENISDFFRVALKIYELQQSKDVVTFKMIADVMPELTKQRLSEIIDMLVLDMGIVHDNCIKDETSYERIFEISNGHVERIKSLYDSIENL